MADRKALRLAAGLLFGGLLFTVLVGLLHPDREAANNHIAVFAEYAADSTWTLVHLGQFAGMAIVVAGLLALSVALDSPAGSPGLLNRLGAAGAVATLALYGVLQAVDGVALKQAVDAWARAPEAEKAVRFAAAETVRWLEWGVRSYHAFALGLTLLLFAIMIVATARISRPVGVLMGLTGAAYVAQGFVVGAQGFSNSNTIPTLSAYILWLVWGVWLLVAAWRAPAASEQLSASGAR